MSKKVAKDNKVKQIKKLENKLKKLQKNWNNNIQEMSDIQYQINILEYETKRNKT